MGRNRPDDGHRFDLLRRWMVGVGTAIAIPSSIYLALGILGLVPTDFLSLGPSSGLKTVASIAVLGCLMAAVGYWDDYERY